MRQELKACRLDHFKDVKEIQCFLCRCVVDSSCFVICMNNTFFTHLAEECRYDLFGKSVSHGLFVVCVVLVTFRPGDPFLCLEVIFAWLSM